MIGLVDGDVVLYRAGFAAQSNKKIDHGKYVERVREVQPLSFALHNLDTLMESLGSKFSKLEVYISGSGNWRKEAATIKPYKGNRSPFAKPVYYKELRQHLVKHYDAEIIDGEEADDALGKRQTFTEWVHTEDTCIVSNDKDLMMIPGHHYNFVKDESKYVEYVDGLRNFYVQCLTGDSTDNIPGIYKMGPKTAHKLLEGLTKERAMWTKVRDTWYEKYPDGYGGKSTYKVAKEVASLLWIARYDRERWEEPV